MISEIITEIIQGMEKNPSTIEAGLSFFSATRHLERIADHATNIKNQERMTRLAGSIDRAISLYDALPFEKYPTHDGALDFQLARFPDL